MIYPGNNLTLTDIYIRFGLVSIQDVAIYKVLTYVITNGLSKGNGINAEKDSD